MPSGETAELLTLSRQLAESELSRTMVLSLSLESGGEDAPSILVEAARRFSTRLEDNPDVSTAWSA